MLEIARRHPEYGYRRTATKLGDRGFHVNHKVIERLTRKINPVSRLKEIDDLEVLYTDFTEIRYQRGMAKAQLMPVIDNRSKLVVGHTLGKSGNTELALEA